MRSQRSAAYRLLLIASITASTILLLLPGLALASTGTHNTKTHTLYQSRLLWATIDMCDPADKSNTVGIRGSMPSDGHAHDKMYMSFRLQYLNTKTEKWVDLAVGQTPSFVSVGSAASARQDGSSFELVAPSSSVTLRGLVEFQWRSGQKVLHSTSKVTEAGHKSLAGADPANFSAATCVIG